MFVFYLSNQPQSAELKNLLLLVNPDKWQDRMRTVAASRDNVIVEDDLDHTDTRGAKKTNGGGGGGGGASANQKDQSWLARITASANEAIKVTG